MPLPRGRYCLCRHRRLVEGVTLQGSGRGADDLQTRQDLAQVEEAHLDLALGNEFGAGAEHGGPRLRLDLIEDTGLHEYRGRHRASEVGHRRIAVRDGARSE